jgi:hypothetical protein
MKRSTKELAAMPEGERRPWEAAAAAKYVSDVSGGGLGELLSFH